MAWTGSSPVTLAESDRNATERQLFFFCGSLGMHFLMLRMTTNIDCGEATHYDVSNRDIGSNQVTRVNGLSGHCRLQTVYPACARSRGEWRRGGRRATASRIRNSCCNGLFGFNLSDGRHFACTSSSAVTISDDLITRWT